MTTKSYTDEKVAELDSAFDWADQIKDAECDRWQLMYGFTPEKLKQFFKESLTEAYSKGREDERNDDSPLGEGLFEGRKLKELSRPELYRAIERFDGLYRSALQSHE